jgi:hypothetical protein
MDVAALNDHTVKRSYREFLIKSLGDIQKYTGFSPLLCGRKTLENEKHVANQMPGFVGAGS